MHESNDNNLYLVDDVPFELEMSQLLRRLHVKEGSRFMADVERLREEALAVARPKALYKRLVTTWSAG